MVKKIWTWLSDHWDGRIKQSITFVVSFVCLCGVSWGFKIYHAETPQIFAWDETAWETWMANDCNQNPIVVGRYLEYELQFIEQETGKIYSYTAKNTTLKIQPPTSGIYSVSVRTKLMNADGTRTKLCLNPPTIDFPSSAWCEANSPCGTLKTGVSGEWKIIFGPLALAAPSGLVIIR